MAGQSKVKGLRVLGGLGFLIVVIWAAWPSITERGSPQILHLPSPGPPASPQLDRPLSSIVEADSAPSDVEPASPEALVKPDPEREIRGSVLFAGGQPPDEPVLVVAWPSRLAAESAQRSNSVPTGHAVSRAWVDASGRFVLTVPDASEYYDLVAAGEGTQCDRVAGVSAGGDTVQFVARALYGVRFRFTDDSGERITAHVPSRGISVKTASNVAARHADVDPVARGLLGWSRAGVPSYADAAADSSNGGLPSVLYASSDDPYVALQGLRFYTGVAGFEEVWGEVSVPRVTNPLPVVEIPLTAEEGERGGIRIRWKGSWSPDLIRHGDQPEVWFWSESRDWFRYSLFNLQGESEQVNGLPYGTYSVQLRLPHGESVSWNGVVVGKERPDLDVDLSVRGRLTVQILTEDGKPYMGSLKVTLFSEYRGLDSGTLEADVGFSSAPYVLSHVAPGEYHVQVRTSGGVLVGNGTAVVRAGESALTEVELASP